MLGSIILLCYKLTAGNQATCLPVMPHVTPSRRQCIYRFGSIWWPVGNCRHGTPSDEAMWVCMNCGNERDQIEGVSCLAGTSLSRLHQISLSSAGRSESSNVPAASKVDSSSEGGAGAGGKGSLSAGLMLAACWPSSSPAGSL